MRRAPIFRRRADVLSIAFMIPPPRYSVTPLPGFATRPGGREPTVVEMLGALWRWLRGKRPSARERFAEARRVERLAAELDALDSEPRSSTNAQTASPPPESKPAPARRRGGRSSVSKTLWR
jgi:hypothetical protein